MKVKKFVLCVLLSLALTVTFIPVMSFAGSGLDINDHGTIVISNWTQDSGSHTTWVSQDGAASALLCGGFSNFGGDNYPHALIGEKIGVMITPPAGQHVESVKCNGTPLRYSEHDDRYLFTVNADTVDDTGRTPGNIIEITFAEGGFIKEIDKHGAIKINGWTQDPGAHTTWEGPDGASAELCGTFSNFSGFDNFPHSIIGEIVDIEITPPTGYHVEEVTLNGEPIGINDDERYTFNVLPDIKNGSDRIPGNIIDITFAEGEVVKEIDKHGAIKINSWQQDEGGHANWTGPDGATAELSGEFRNFQGDNYPHSLIGNTVFVDVVPPKGMHVGALTLNGMPLEADPDSGSYSFIVGADKVNGKQRTPGNIIDISFEEGEIIKDVNDYGAIEIQGWQYDAAGYLWAGPDGAEAEFSEAQFSHFDTDEYPHALIGEEVYLDVYPPEDQTIADVTLNGTPLTADEDSGTYTFEVNADSVSGDQREAGNVITISFEDAYGFEELSEDAMNSADEIALDEEQDVDTEDKDGLFAFTPQEGGVYVFYSKDKVTSGAFGKGARALRTKAEQKRGIDPVGRVSDADGNRIQTGNDYDGSHFKVFFDAEEGETYYLQAKSSNGTAAFTVGLMKSDIEAVSFSSGGQNVTAEKSCTSARDYQIDEPFQVGDKLTVTYTNIPAKEYVCEEVSDGNETRLAFLNTDESGKELPGDLELDLSQAVDSGNTIGSTKEITAKAIYAALESEEFTINVKYEYRHGEIEHHPDVAKSCTSNGNIEYWQCNKCKRYYGDEDGLNLISAGSLIIPGGHQTTPKTDPAGYLVNGSKYDLCSVCGKKLNYKVLPGWATSYVKKMKVKKGKKSFTVKWKKQSKKNLKKFNGYEIRYSTAANMSGAKTVKAGKKAKSKKIKGLKKTVYYVQMRSYTVSGGKTYYSAWTTKKVKTK